MKKTVLVTGSVAYDRIMNFPGRFGDHILPKKIHSLNISFLVNNFRESFGGTAGNIAYNLSLLGESAEIACRVGARDWEAYKKWTAKKKIGTKFLSVEKNKHTAAAHIITDQDDNQITGFYPGAMEQPIYPKIKKQLSKAIELVIVSPQHPVDMVEIPKLCRQKKNKYIFDPGQQITSLDATQLRNAISGAYVLIGNDYEIAVITKRTGWSLKQLTEMVSIVIITLGAKGSLIMVQGKSHHIPPAKITAAVDPTGAGDAYRAGLIHGMLQSWPWDVTGRFAGTVAAYTVEKEGTQTHSFSLATIKRRYRQNFGKAL